jgi:uncharacterized protein YdaU (DUF1376 family)
MNYYEHHLGDYDSNTVHLSWTEDIAYRRMICIYYRTEKPLPVDIKQIYRLTRASSKQEREAVDTVLAEFFVQHDDGWHNDRCDNEIALYREGDAERELKAAHEKERMRRHREERSRLFAELRAIGITPKWDTPVTQLRDILKARSNAPETRTGEEQEQSCNAPATANHTHTHTHIPILKPSQDALLPTKPPPTTKLGPRVAVDNSKPYGKTAAVLIPLGVKVTAQHPVLLAWCDDGFSIEQLQAAVEIARLNKPAPEPIPPNYLDRIVRDPPKPSKPREKRAAWYETEQGILAKGAEFGMAPRSGESWPEFKQRINLEIDRRKMQTA